MNFDVFNGDADGICALVQLRLAQPVESVLVTGVKRDISLLKRVQAKAGDKVTVLDISLDKNRQPLLELLDVGCEVFYVDHHQASDIPEHSNFSALIDTNADVCTSLLVDRYLNHRFTAWAVTAAFGDNLNQSAAIAAKGLSLSEQKLNKLRLLGVYINYNGYGVSLDDLFFSPDKLYQLLSSYESPFQFMADRPDVYKKLQDGYAHDMTLAQKTSSEYLTDKIAVFILPNEKWARRVSGVWSNELANAHPERAHAVLSVNQKGGYTVSVRAPLENKVGADVLCSGFQTGGGRKSAAGINNLPFEELSFFISAFQEQYR